MKRKKGIGKDREKKRRFGGREKSGGSSVAVLSNRRKGSFCFFYEKILLFAIGQLIWSCVRLAYSV